MSNEEKFRTLFNKMMTGNYVPGCIKRSETEEKDFPYHIAYNVFINGRINCYGFACSIASIAKELGYEPYVIIMNYDHAVVEIDGKYYDNMGARFGASQPAITDFEVEQKVKFQWSVLIVSLVSNIFLIFVIFSVITYYVVPAKIKWVTLLIFSYIYYLAGGVRYLFFILYSTVVVYLFGLWIDNLQQKEKASKVQNRVKDKNLQKSIANLCMRHDLCKIFVDL